MKALAVGATRLAIQKAMLEYNALFDDFQINQRIS